MHCITIGTSFLGKILLKRKKIENNKLHLRLLWQQIETIHDFQKISKIRIAYFHLYLKVSNITCEKEGKCKIELLPQKIFPPQFITQRSWLSLGSCQKLKSHLLYLRYKRNYGSVRTKGSMSWTLIVKEYLYKLRLLLLRIHGN